MCGEKSRAVAMSLQTEGTVTLHWTAAVTQLRKAVTVSQTHTEAERRKCRVHYIFDSRHLELLVIMQGCMRVAHVVAESGHRHFVTVMQRHCDCHCPQCWDILKNI